MRRGGVPAEAAEAILVRFTDAGLIDDAAFARAWVESRHYSRGLSKRSLSAELRRNGIQNEQIREAVDTLDPEQEVATARRLVERKLASTRGRPPETRVRQAAGLLARKGYPPGLAFRLIREAMQDEDCASRHRPGRANRAGPGPRPLGQRSRPRRRLLSVTCILAAAEESQPAPIPANPRTAPGRCLRRAVSSQVAPRMPNVRLTHRS